MSHCRSCNAPIAWVVTPNNKRMPVNLERITIVTDDGRTVTGRTSHFSTCPAADKHRKHGP